MGNVIQISKKPSRWRKIGAFLDSDRVYFLSAMLFLLLASVAAAIALKSWFVFVFVYGLGMSKICMATVVRPVRIVDFEDEK